MIKAPLFAGPFFCLAGTSCGTDGGTAFHLFRKGGLDGFNHWNASTNVPHNVPPNVPVFFLLFPV